MAGATPQNGMSALGPRRRTVLIPIPGGTVVAAVAGDGERVLLIHGLGGTRHTWDGVTDTLARTHTVIAVDLPGQGDSRAPAGDYSLGAHAAALRDVPGVALADLLTRPTAPAEPRERPTTTPAATHP